MTIWSILIFVCIKCTRSSYKNQYGLNGVWILVGCDVSLLYRSCLTWCSRIKDSKNQRYVAFQRDLWGILAFPVETGRFASFCRNNKTLSLDFWIILCRMLEVGGVFYQQLGSKNTTLRASQQPHRQSFGSNSAARTAATAGVCGCQVLFPAMMGLQMVFLNSCYAAISRNWAEGIDTYIILYIKDKMTIEYLTNFQRISQVANNGSFWWGLPGGHDVLKQAPKPTGSQICLSETVIWRRHHRKARRELLVQPHVWSVSVRYVTTSHQQQNQDHIELQLWRAPSITWYSTV